MDPKNSTDGQALAVIEKLDAPPIHHHRLFLFSAVLIGLLLIVSLGSLVIINAKLKNKINNPLHTACTEEAKLCPDGSSVGRTGPNCEFPVCPK